MPMDARKASEYSAKGLPEPDSITFSRRATAVLE